MHEKRSRRQFIKGTLGLLGGIATARIAGLFPEAQSLMAQAKREVAFASSPILTSRAEIFEGFVILPEEEGIPGFVQQPSKEFPQLCGVGDVLTTGSTDYLSNFEEFISAVGLPVITVADIDQRSVDSFKSYITRYETGEVFFAIHQIYDAEIDALLSFTLQTNFASPYPVYIVTPVEEGRKLIIPEKVDFLPVPGLAVATENEHHLMWIQNGLLYSFHLNRLVDFEQLRTLAQYLAIRIRNQEEI